MPVASVNDVLQSSLAYQRARLESAAHRIANANVPLQASEVANTDRSETGSLFARQMELHSTGSGSTAVHATSVETQQHETQYAQKHAQQPAQNRLALEPGSPAADENGIVRYPAVDVATEMTTMMSATRSYEATVRAYNILKSMTAKAMEIGK